jgi:hypothetical protein
MEEWREAERGREGTKEKGIRNRLVLREEEGRGVGRRSNIEISFPLSLD